MLWSNKLFIFFLLLSVSACGFQPLYGKGGSTQNTLLAGVKIDPIPNRIGQEFRITLEGDLNPGGTVPANPSYRLHATLGISEGAVNVARDGTISRYNVNMESAYKLYRVSDNSLVTSGALRHVSSYNNITNQYFSTYVAQEDASRRGIKELSEMYRQRLAAYLTSDPSVLPKLKPESKPEKS